MRIQDLHEEELSLLVELRIEAERITKKVVPEEQAQALSDLYAWRNDKTVTLIERSK